MDGVIPDCDDALGQCPDVEGAVLGRRGNDMMRGDGEGEGDDEEFVLRAEVIIDQRVAQACLRRDLPSGDRRRMSAGKQTLSRGDESLPGVRRPRGPTRLFIDHGGIVPFLGRSLRP
ncbi:hypothetical protein C272_06455 [Brevibacterium casei S18]|uniref:Uncharacterized protein n=1 Tax=Brevibacterium casei S18 TaxID=1229781 RepID=K9AKR1_9MICO|nr:hypothetical protein C272_06455 [Brevibacterium casei S18]